MRRLSLALLNSEARHLPSALPGCRTRTVWEGK
jgi:hypothetical protein